MATKFQVDPGRTTGAKLGPQSLASTREYRLALYATDNTTLAAAFDGNETFKLTLWTGDDQTPALELETPDSSAIAWVDHDATAPSLKIVLEAADIAALDPDRYRVSLLINPGSDDIEVMPPRAILELLPVAGEADPPATYCGMDDVRRFCPWIDDVISANPSLQSDLGEVRARARTRLEDRIVACYRPFGRRGAKGSNAQLLWTTVGPGLGDTNEDWLREQLADGVLMTAGARGDRIREITARWTVAMVCENLIGKLGDTTYQELAARYESRAERLCAGFVAYLDTNADDEPDLRIPCGLVVAR